MNPVPSAPDRSAPATSTPAQLPLDIGLASLSDIQEDRPGGLSAGERTRQIIALGVLADEVALNHIGVGEHHTPDFAVSSPAVVLAAIAARTKNLRLTSAVSVLSVLDPVRLYQDFATLDLISGGRAEVTVGRSAFAEPFALFGESLEHYDELFAEKLGLLLKLRDSPVLSWSGQFRAPVPGVPIIPRAEQPSLPVWIGVGGSPDSARRAGQLGLPITLGYLGGPVDRLQQLAGLYRAAGAEAGHSGNLRLGVGVHYYVADTMQEALATYPHYHDFLRPKRPGGSGFLVSRAQFEAGIERGQALMIGTQASVTEKLSDLYRALHFDRLQALPDWGGLPADAVERSVRRLGTEIAPALRELAAGMLMS